MISIVIPKLHRRVIYLEKLPLTFLLVIGRNFETCNVSITSSTINHWILKLEIRRFIMSKASPILNPYHLRHGITNSHFRLIVFLAFPTILTHNIVQHSSIIFDIYVSRHPYILGYSLVKGYLIPLLVWRCWGHNHSNNVSNSR